ncbi:MAG: hypothetical protein H7068_07095, partial [Pedobacter sp.]|nr:hypothetical protein [Chitinophagaceae bacterium]
MHDNYLLKMILVNVLLICSIASFSHTGGHYHKGDGAALNIWTLKNGQQIKGNFSMGNADYILLEQEEGQMIKVSITNLSIQDQQLARFKVKKNEALNAQFITGANN